MSDQGTVRSTTRTPRVIAELRLSAGPVPRLGGMPIVLVEPVRD